jgi:hypothetical protein
VRNAKIGFFAALFLVAALPAAAQKRENHAARQS